MCPATANATAAAVTAAASKPASDALPRNVLPIHYDLDVTPNLETFVYQGHVRIAVDIKAPTSVVVLHTLDIEIRKAEVVLKSCGTRVACLSHSYATDVQQTSLVFAEPLPIGGATFEISFSGKHSDSMSGFYRSSYQVESPTNPAERITRYMVVTQFEPTAARQAFPCFDEPALKATFVVSLTIPANLVALSNMPVTSETAVSPTVKTVLFDKTPIMSSYLLAFAVGEFEHVDASTRKDFAPLPNSVPLRVYTPPGLCETGRFALECACRFLEYYSEVFKIPYMLPKMDMLAVPDFSAGAMENWGLVTYRLNAILYQENQSSAKAKQRVAYVVAHELAHQWFGNLVTMNDWSELWLNEGFATWVGWYAVDKYFPKWNVWAQFVLGDMGRALELDGLLSSHPVVVPVTGTSDISQIFDAISYSKGASVIRMLGGWLTGKVFLDGVALYLSKHKYANATTDKLWDALSEVSGRDVAAFMRNWTLCTGYPVLKVTLGEEKKTGTLIVEQSRFLSHVSATADSAGESESEATLWCCPLGVEGHDFLLDSAKCEFVLSDSNCKDGAVKINCGQHSFYRVSYPSKVISLLGHCQKLSEIDRTGMLGDAFALCLVGRCATTDALDLCIAQRELAQSYVVLQQVADSLGKIKAVWALEGEKLNQQLGMMISSIFAPVLKRLGWDFDAAKKGDDADHQEGLLRALAIHMCGLNGNEEVIKHAQKLFSEREKTPIHPNIRSAVYAIAVKTSEVGDRSTYDTVRKIYEQQDLTVDHRLSALVALGQTRDEALLAELLAYTLDCSKPVNNVRVQDWIYPFRAVACNPVGRMLAWRSVRDNWSLIEEKFRISLSMVGHFVELVDDWADRELASREVEEFFSKRHTGLFNRALSQTLEKIAGQDAWLRRDRVAVSEWLSKL